MLWKDYDCGKRHLILLAIVGSAISRLLPLGMSVLSILVGLIVVANLLAANFLVEHVLGGPTVLVGVVPIKLPLAGVLALTLVTAVLLLGIRGSSVATRNPTPNASFLITS